MQVNLLALCFIYTASILFIYTCLQCKYHEFYIRFEKMFLVKKSLSIRLMGKHFFWVISIEHLLASVFFLFAILLTKFALMAVFFVAMYHSTLLFRKIIPYYTLAWWLDKITIFSAIIVMTTTYYGISYFEKLDWNKIFMFSFCFFLITFTTYFLKQLYFYFYGKTIRQRLQALFKGSSR